MARVNAIEYQEKHARRLKASTEDIRKGIKRVSVAPGVLAAEQVEVLIANFTEAARSGKWSEKVAGVSLQEWQDSFLNKGVDRIAAGIDGAKEKTIKSAEKLLKNVDTVSEEVKRMPRGTIDDSINRMTHAARRMHELSKSK